jgi:hypothetical protein
MACRILRDSAGEITNVVAANGKISELYLDLLDRNNGNVDIAINEYLYAQSAEFKSYIGEADVYDENGEVLSEMVPPLSVSMYNSTMRGFTAEEQVEVIRTLIKEVVTRRRVLGEGFDYNVAMDPNNPKSIAHSLFLSNAYTNEAGDKLSNSEIAKLAELEAAVDAEYPGTEDHKKAMEAFDKYMEENGYYKSPPTSFLSARFPGLINAAGEFLTDEAEDQAIRLAEDFFRVWKDFVPNVDKYGNPELSWRTLMESDLGAFGIKLKEDKIEVVDDQETQEKIFGKSSLEDNPAKTLSTAMKELLIQIPAINANFMGFKTFIPLDVVYTELASVFSGKTTGDQMMAELNTLANYKPEFVAVYEYMKRLSRGQRASVISTFSLTYKNFLTTKRTEVNGVSDVAILNPNSTSLVTGTARRWKAQSVEGTLPEARALYKQTKNEDGTVTLSVKEGKDKVIFDNYKSLFKTLKLSREEVITENENFIHPAVQALANLMWEMSMQYGSISKEEHTRKLQQYINKGVVVERETNTDGGARIAELKGRALLLELVFPSARAHRNLNLGILVNGVIEFETGKTGIPEKLIGARKNPTSIFDSSAKIIKHLAIPAKYLNNARAESFTTASGKQVYPNTLPSHMDDIVTKLASPQAMELIDEYLEDPFMNPLDKVEHRALFLRLLNDPRYKKALDRFVLDGAVNRNNEASGYENMSPNALYALRFNMYVNNGNKDIFFSSVPTQADRKQYAPFPFVRLSSMQKFGIPENTESAVLRSLIIQDLIRIARAKEDLTRNFDNNRGELVEPYHYQGDALVQVDGQKKFTGTAFDDVHMQVDVTDDMGLPIVTDEVIGQDELRANGVQQLSDVITDYLRGTLSEEEKAEVDARLTRMVDKAMLQFDKYATELVEILKPIEDELAMHTINTKMGGLNKAARAFVIDDFLARTEEIKMFRGSRAYAGGMIKTYKRMGQLSTPGIKGAQQNDSWVNAPQEEDFQGNWGLPETINEVTLEDIRMDLNGEQAARYQERNNQLREGMAQVKQIVEGLGLPWSEEKEQRIVDSYMPGRVEGTDAMAYISLDFYRDVLQSFNKWGVHEENAWKNYNNMGKFRYVSGPMKGRAVPMKPLKPYLEDLINLNGSKVPISHKNHYHVLLREMTEYNPELDNVRRRMEADGEYAGLEPVHVVNFVTGQKLARKGVSTTNGVEGDLMEVTVNNVSTRGLRFPQIIPDAKKQSIAPFNRQLRKNGINFIYDDQTYTLNAGLEGAVEMTGAEMKELYGAAIEERLRRETDAVIEELNLAGAPLDMMQSIRDILSQEAKERDFPLIFEQALQIVVNEAGQNEFLVDLDFPILGDKFQQIITARFNNAAFKLKVPGMEAVQVAHLGGHAVSKELKFLTIEDNGKRVSHADVLIKPSLGRRFGVKPGDSLEDAPEELRRILGYRIPHQGKSSTLIMKIEGWLPDNYEKAIVVPPEVTMMMGSDFDVDKMFILFPEVEKVDGELKKVRPPYKQLRGKTDLSNLSTPELNNIMMDTIEAVAASPLHLLETMAPLDESTLKEVKEMMEQENPELLGDDQFASPHIEVDMAIRNQLGNALRGLWANFNAGTAVAHNGVLYTMPQFAPRIDGETYTRFVFEKVGNPELSDPALYTDEMGSRRLSSAVDAAKEMLQFAMNDTAFTYPVAVHLLSSYPDELFIARFLNSAPIRQLSEVFANTYNNDPRQFTAAFAEVAKEWGALTDLKKITTTNISSEQLKAYPSDKTYANSTSEERAFARDLLHNFYMFYKAGRQKVKLYKAITPDSLDGINSVTSVFSYEDKVRDFEESHLREQVIYGFTPGTNPADQFLFEDAYPISRGFYNLHQSIKENISKVFPAQNSPAMNEFVDMLRMSTGRTGFSGEQHRDIRKALFYIMLSKPGSPLADFFSESHIALTYKGTSLMDKVENLVLEFPLLADNVFLKGLSRADNTDRIVPRLNFEFGVGALSTEKNIARNALYALLYTPQLFLTAEQNTESARKRIQNLGEDLAMHAILSSAFKGRNYIEVIPTEFFVRRRVMRYGPNAGQLTKVSPMKFFKQQKAALNNSAYFANDLHAFMRSFGTMRSAGAPLLSSRSRKTTKPQMLLKNEMSRFVKVYDKTAKKSYIYERTQPGSDVYNRLSPMGEDYSFFELNIRTLDTVNTDNEILFVESVFPENNVVESGTADTLDVSAREFMQREIDLTERKTEDEGGETNLMC